MQDAARQGQLENLDQRIGTVDSRVEEAQEIFSKRFNQIKEQV